jgi:hypothetical protein
MHQMSSTRTRWAAIGAAVAVSLGAGGIGIGHATTDSGDGPVSAFFPIEPCRLADNQPIGADSSVTLDGWGATGACNLPTDTTGLVANVTAVNATQQTNLRFYAAGDAVPDTANLNPTPGAPPTPNSVNVPLDATNGQFQVYNRFGTVAVYIDVMGYYDDHTHDDRYYTKEEVDAGFVAAPAGGPPTEHWINGYDFRPIDPASGWAISLVWAHAASGTNECIVAPVDLAAGTVIAGLEMSYLASAPAEASLQLVSLRHTAGPTAGVIDTASDTAPLPATAPNTVGSAGVTFATAVTVQADRDHVVAVCTDDALSMTGFRLVFG